jgi:DNA-binding transcriptional MerR regulator
MADERVLEAFGEEHVERLTGLTRRQLRCWAKTGFFKPSYEVGGVRVYTFRDLVALRTLGLLRREHGVSLQHLREVAERLSHLHPDLWLQKTLYVLDKRVVFDDDSSGLRLEPASGQIVADVPLRRVMGNVENAARALRDRPPEQIGKVERPRSIAHNAWIVAGTRIPTRAVKRFHDAGYSIKAIIREYPSLTEADVRAALAHEEEAAAAA